MKEDNTCKNIHSQEKLMVIVTQELLAAAELIQRLARAVQSRRSVQIVKSMDDVMTRAMQIQKEALPAFHWVKCPVCCDTRIVSQKGPDGPHFTLRCACERLFNLILDMDSFDIISGRDSIRQIRKENIQKIQSYIHLFEDV